MSAATPTADSKPKRVYRVAIVVGSERFPATTKTYATRAEADKARDRQARRRPGLVVTVVSQRAA